MCNTWGEVCGGIRFGEGCAGQHEAGTRVVFGTCGNRFASYLQLVDDLPAASGGWVGGDSLEDNGGCAVDEGAVSQVAVASDPEEETCRWGVADGHQDVG